MNSRTRPLSSDRRFPLFLLAGLTVLAACMAIMRTAAFARNPDVGYFGVTFDLCISIPLIYALVVVRGGHARPFSIVPVFIVCMIVARAVIPAAHRDFLHQLGLLQAPMELAVLIAIALRLRAATGAVREEGDLVERIELICRPFFGESRVSQIVAGEMTALYLGLFGWRVQSPKARGIASTTFHRRVGWGSVVACILVLIAAESTGLHLLVQRWNPYVAWFITALDIWGAIWILGDYQAFRLRPLVVTHDRLELRFGFRWSANIPREQIAGIDPLSPTEAERLRRSRRYLRLSLLDEPTYAIRLRKPVRMKGAMGLTRIVTCIGIGPDDTAVIDALQKTAGSSQ